MYWIKYYILLLCFTVHLCDSSPKGKSVSTLWKCVEDENEDKEQKWKCSPRITSFFPTNKQKDTEGTCIFSSVLARVQKNLRSKFQLNTSMRDPDFS